MQGRKILVIDDDPSTTQLLKSAFAKAGGAVITANNGQEGLQQFYTHRPDLIILDVKMPDMDGWETCRIIRKLSNVPIIMLTIRDNDEEIIRGLDSGADDYITKPFNAKVVLARARAVLRRPGQNNLDQTGTRYSDGYLMIDLEKTLVLVKGEPVKLTAQEYKLLAYFLQNPNKMLTTQQILKNAWGWEYEDQPGHVRIYVWHLRRKLEEDPRKPKYFLTEYGLGYRFQTQSEG
ncbi:MAG: response regulator transcription factor [Anaerolineae bacterium]|nr:response regulator transcription factor [Anaerolineae bacterium]